MDYNLWQKVVGGDKLKNLLTTTLLGGDLTTFQNQSALEKLATLTSLANPLTYARSGVRSIQDQDSVNDAILNTTKPFRKGANILAQNYGSLGGKDMSKGENRGKFLSYLAGSLTPQEQEEITNRPILESVKSGAGMASTLMPFAQAGSFNVANPILKKILPLITRGAVEGSSAGLGYSRTGKELQDTLTGTALGTFGELIAGISQDPQLRKAITDRIMSGEQPGKYSGYLGAADNPLDDLMKEAKKYKTPEELLESLGHGERGLGQAVTYDKVQFHGTQDRASLQNAIGKEELRGGGKFGEGFYLTPRKDSATGWSTRNSSPTRSADMGVIPIDTSGLKIYRFKYPQDRHLDTVKKMGFSNLDDFNKGMRGQGYDAVFYDEDGVTVVFNTKKLKVLDTGSFWEKLTGGVKGASTGPGVDSKGLRDKSLSSEGLEMVRERIDGRDISHIQDRMDVEDREIMEKFIDTTRLKKKEDINNSIAARRIAEGMGLNPDVKNSELANKFAKILEFWRYRQIPPK